MNGRFGPRAFNIPPMVRNLAIANALLYALPALLLDGNAYYDLLLTFGLRPDLYDTWLSGAGALPWTAGAAWLTHMFLHGSFAHFAINMGFLVAFGSPVEQRLGTARFLAFYLLCGLVGVLTHLLFNFGQPYPMIGASGAISGVLGGAVLFAMDHRSPEARRLVRLRLGPRGRIFAVSWVVINVVFGIFGLGGLTEGAVIAWEAHLGGFFAGLLLMPTFDRRRETVLR